MRSKLRMGIMTALPAVILAITALPIFCYAEPTTLNEIGSIQEQVQQSQQSTQSSSQSSSLGTSTQNSTSSSTIESPIKIDESDISDTNKSSAEAVSEIFKQGALTPESVEKSKKWVEPIAKLINLMIAIILGILSAFLVLISVLDLIYIQVPVTRTFLKGSQSQTSSTVVGGINPQVGPLPLQPQPQTLPQPLPQPGLGSTPALQTSPVLSRQWVSDEAIAALNEAQPQQSAPQSPIINAQQLQAQALPGGKSVMLSYLKKRAFALIMLGVCVLLFTCTIFTDLGTALGIKVIALLSGINL